MGDRPTVRHQVKLGGQDTASDESLFVDDPDQLFELSEALHGAGDAQNSLKWMEEAAKEGKVEAQRALGEWYRAGDGAPQDASKSYMWFSLAAERGDHASSQALLDLATNLTPEQLVQARQKAADVASQLAAKAVTLPALFGSLEIQNWVEHLPGRWGLNGLRRGGAALAAVTVTLSVLAFLAMSQDIPGNMAGIMLPAVVGSVAWVALLLLVCIVAAGFGLGFILRWRIAKGRFAEFDQLIRSIRRFAIAGWMVVAAPMGFVGHLWLSDNASTTVWFIVGAMIIGLAVGIGTATVSEKTLRKAMGNDHERSQ